MGTPLLSFELHSLFVCHSYDVQKTFLFLHLSRIAFQVENAPISTYLTNHIGLGCSFSLFSFCSLLFQESNSLCQDFSLFFHTFCNGEYNRKLKINYFLSKIHHNYLLLVLPLLTLCLHILTNSKNLIILHIHLCPSSSID